MVNSEEVIGSTEYLT